jgi:outer membrane cobalamin receptor
LPKFKNMGKRILSLALFCCFCFAASAQNSINIKGFLIDRGTKESLVGATISVSGNKAVSTGLDGSFTFSFSKQGTYNFHCSYIGYRTLDTTVAVNNNSRLVLRLTSSSSELRVVSIAGSRNRETESAAKKDEQNAPQVLNVISSKAIQLSPDIVVANVLQRVSGVSLERSSSGDGRYAIIRGMDQRYNYTLINGIKIPSPDNKNRYVPLDIFPAELVERIEVTKALTPNMEGDAVGGTVNMVMKNAPDRLYVNASLSTGYSQNLFNRPFKSFPVSAINTKSPYEAHGPAYSAKPGDFTRDNLSYTDKNFTPNTMASLSIGNRFFNNKLGIMLGASYQNTYKGYSGILNPGEYYDETNKEGALRIKHANSRDYSTHVTRTGLNAKMDYRINDDNKISLYGFYAILNEAQTRLTVDTLQPAPRVGVGTGQVWNFGRSRYQHQSIANGTLQGEHRILPGLKFDWTAAYSEAKSNVPDLAEYENDGGFFADGTSSVPYEHPLKTTDYHRIWERNSDRDISGYGNLAYSNKVKNIPFTITAGGMYRDKHRDNLFQDYELRTVPNTDGSFQTWTDIYHFNWSVFNPGGSPASPNTYRADENISAGYGMLKFKVNKLETVLGARVENTSQKFDTDLPVTIAGKSGDISYSDLLPSVHFTYLLNEKTNLRLSYFASINRPGYFEIIPTNKKGDDFTETGNPNLKHATADNLDFRYELFPSTNEQLLLGVFYKHIQNPIEYGFVGNKADEYQPGNFGDATNYGFEAVFEKYISKFGIRVNYTYTKSSISTTKIKTFNNARIEPAPEQTRPMQGQSEHIANAALLYKDTKNGLDLQLAWQYTGKRIALVSPYFGFDEWQKPLSMFDFSAEKKFAKRYALFIKVQNLLNTADEYYINKPVTNPYPVPNETPGSPTTLSRRNLYGQNYQIGFRFILN